MIFHILNYALFCSENQGIPNEMTPNTAHHTVPNQSHPLRLRSHNNHRSTHCYLGERGVRNAGERIEREGGVREKYGKGGRVWESGVG
jgi:hypothetical protein